MTTLFKPGVWAKLFPKAAPELLKDLEEQGNFYFTSFGCDNTKSAAWYLANVAEESTHLTKMEESLYYTPRRLMQVWPKRFPSVARANIYARNPQRLANNVYANRMGNGDEGSGDGWRYRGRGPIQITGKDMYERVDKLLGLGGELVKDPDLALTHALALPLIVAVYKIKNLHMAKTFRAMVVSINGGTTNMESRLAIKKNFEAILK
jgi:putative chitinase